MFKSNEFQLSYISLSQCPLVKQLLVNLILMLLVAHVESFLY